MTLMTTASRRALAMAVALALTVAAGGCSSGSTVGVGPTDGRVIRVVAAENFWGSLATQLGGSHAHVVSLITSPNTDPHDYEPTAGDGRTLADAQLVIENGVGYDAWVAKITGSNGTPGQRTLDVGRLVGAKVGANPHRWYFPSDVEQVIGQITREYQRLDPADSAYFEERRQALESTGLARYHRLLAGIRSRYAHVRMGASESIFVGLAQATDLDLVTPSSFLNAISEGTDPTAGDKATVDRQITTGQIKVFVYNSQNSTPDIQRLVAAARSHRIPVTTITETLTPVGATFQDWQSAQLQALEAALVAAGH